MGPSPPPSWRASQSPAGPRQQFARATYARRESGALLPRPEARAVLQMDRRPGAEAARGESALRLGREGRAGALSDKPEWPEGFCPMLRRRGAGNDMGPLTWD